MGTRLAWDNRLRRASEPTAKRECTQSIVWEGGRGRGGEGRDGEGGGERGGGGGGGGGG